MTSRILRRGAVADSYQTASGLFIVSYTESASGFNNNTGTTRTASGISVVNGDLLVVFAAQEDVSGTFGAPTSTGVTFGAAKHTNNTGNNCRSYAYVGAVTADNVSQSVQASVPSGKYCGLAVFVLRGAAYGTVAGETNVTEAPSIDLTATKSGSVGLYIQADWNAGDGTSRTWRTINSIVGTERAYMRNSSAYTVYVGSWSNLGSTGTKTFGLSAPSGQQISQIAVEITTP